MGRQIAEKKQKETMERLRAATHITQNHFTEHRRVEGYFEDRNVSDFYGCDRLLKMETLFGRIQMGYDPRRGQSFLFANIKTSVYDTAATSAQRSMRQQDWRRAVKTGTQNIAYSSRRRAASATILYKAENKPWSEESIRHYLDTVNLETLQKTMPFLDRRAEQERRAELDEARRERALETAQATAISEEALQFVRARQMAQEMESDRVNAILTVKQSQSRQFFRRMNLVFDLQKQKMFNYYRAEREKRAVAAAQSATVTPRDKNDANNNKGDLNDNHGAEDN